MFKDLIKEHYPEIVDSELLEEIESVAKWVTLKEGATLMDIGGYMKVMPLVFKGAIKVLREDDDGNELFLYYLTPGETCAITMNCCVANKPSEIRAIAEDNTEILTIPIQYIEQWMQKYHGWRTFILQALSNRINDLLETIDNIAFLNLDERLLKYLEEKAKATNSEKLNITHQEIAYDMNTSREVVSRLLKKLENMEKLKLGRNKLELLN